MKTKFLSFADKYFRKMYRRSGYKLLLIIFGFPTFLALFIYGKLQGKSNKDKALKTEIRETLIKDGTTEALLRDAVENEERKAAYLGLKTSAAEIKKRAQALADHKLEAQVVQMLEERLAQEGIIRKDIISQLMELMNTPIFFVFSIVSSFFMYLLMFIYAKPYIKYITERLVMMLFVILGVVILVFSIMYISPMDPAKNILGEDATPAKIAEFEKIYGLDKPYFEQLAHTIKKFVTFDFGNSFVGNENIQEAISRRFPITVQLSFAALFVSVAIAIPSGIISAIKQYSALDYLFMLIALLGLSIPNFWLGLILILNFSINLGWLPAMYSAENLATLIMPAIVLGTGLSATVARMTRSSMLEVKNQDYILTARAKGLSERRVILKHILGNAMIPIVTVIGLQFGGLLGGSSVTEKVFNVNGLGKYIIEKQFIPDIPVVLAGVVYIAVVVSMVNLLVDILYAFLDPRIKSKIKNY